jgi:YD repeat-containing protein
MPNFGNAADATRLVNEEPQPHNHHAQTLYERFRAEFEQRRAEREINQQNEWEMMFGEPTIEVVNNGNGQTIQYTFNDAANVVATARADGTVAE